MASGARPASHRHLPPMSDGGATNLEAALWSIGAFSVVLTYGLVAFFLRRYLDARDERVRAEAYRRGRDDEKASHIGERTDPEVSRLGLSEHGG